MSNQSPKTLFDKIWSDHLVRQRDDGTSLLYIDRHLVHEVTSPQAFEGLKIANRSVHRPDATIAVADHNVPTINRQNIEDPQSKIQVETLAQNTKEHGIQYFDLMDQRQGIVHIIGPEQGITQPGMTIVCGDSHTSTLVLSVPWLLELVRVKLNMSLQLRQLFKILRKICAFL